MIKSTLNQDGTARLSIGTEEVVLTPRELERQIAELASIRARMLDSVPSEAPYIENVVQQPIYALRTDRVTCASLLSLRHPGFGWIHFELAAKDALVMRRMWTEIVSKLDLEPAVGSYDGPERRTSKPH
ncbi:MAG: hypothetical protein JWR21_382 [Herminiimonas sp.]|nr:hypothetical protein [Herminiimonas sp.]MDB5852064.1 hypothetical protein [Herminiimonas sp.]